MVTDLALPWHILPLFFLIAILYSSVGHGGASGYLALFALYGVTATEIVPIALALNIIVAGTGFLVFRRAGYFSIPLLLPFIVSSIPAAFLGGYLAIPDHTYKVLLSIVLFLAALRIFLIGEVKKKAQISRRKIWALGLLFGLLLGFLSGMIGVGGGIFLSPLILFLGWADIKQTAAVSSAFIVLNSVSGFAGHVVGGKVILEPVLLLAGVVLAGGVVGSYAGAARIKQKTLQKVLGVVLIAASMKIFI